MLSPFQYTAAHQLAGYWACSQGKCGKIRFANDRDQVIYYSDVAAYIGATAALSRSMGQSATVNAFAVCIPVERRAPVLPPPVRTAPRVERGPSWCQWQCQNSYKGNPNRAALVDMCLRNC